MFFTLFCSIASPRLYDCIVYYLFSGTFEGGLIGGGVWHIYLSVKWFDNLIYKKWCEETPYCRCNRSVLTIHYLTLINSFGQKLTNFLFTGMLVPNWSISH